MNAQTPDPRLAAIAAAIAANRIAEAEAMLRPLLTENPENPPALRLLAEVAARRNRLADAERMLRHALDLAPGFAAARFDLAVLLNRTGRPAEAVVELDRLLAVAPGARMIRQLKAAALGRQGEYAGAIAIYEAMLAETPQDPRGWLSLGHVRATVGDASGSVAAYRTAVAQAPGLGAGWWSLANLKTHRFSDADIAAMTSALSNADLADDDRIRLDFALGKALEDRADYPASFRHYLAGNQRRRKQVEWDAAANRRHRLDSESLLTPDFFAARAGQGAAANDPIFVVGLPRSGSTLIEQILASHSQVEGTMELPDIAAIAAGLGADRGKRRSYLHDLATCAPDRLRAMGDDYLARTRVQRKTGRPRFIDKMPNNFAYIGLIQLILPNAVIIDTRRGAMATCFSAWKQHFAHGQTFTYDLTELGQFYADYVALMDHYDGVLPGRVLRVQHEDLVTDTETQVRRLLAHCGLDFEPACLSAHENTRAVRTPSAAQVRQPITAAGIDQWRNYDPWLGELRAALGPELAA